MPDIVAARYLKQPPPRDARAAAEKDLTLRLDAGTNFPYETRLAPGSRAYLWSGGAARELQVERDGRLRAEIKVAAGESVHALATSSPSGATSFQRLTLRGLTPDDRDKEQAETMTPAFIERLRQANLSPLVEGDRATFVYRGPARRVEVVGDFTGWSPRGHVLTDVPRAGVKFYTLKFPPGARLEYKFIADGAWTLDPANPNKVDNGVGGENSVLAMPAYRASVSGDEVAEMPLSRERSAAILASLASGRGGVAVRPPPGGFHPSATQAQALLLSDEVPTGLPGGARKISVYLPPGYAASQARYPVLYVQDGTDYLRRGGATAVAQQLISQKQVAPFIIVFVDPVDRMKEYWADDRFADFMAKELVPHVDARYRTRPTRDARALLGASLGGVISVWTALRHPDVFARVGGQSSAFQIDDERVVAALAALGGPTRQTQPFRFYFDVGRFEPILEVNRRVRLLLAARGYPVAYRESDTGHNYTAWRDQLAEALLALWK